MLESERPFYDNAMNAAMVIRGDLNKLGEHIGKLDKLVVKAEKAKLERTRKKLNEKLFELRKKIGDKVGD